jgi:hypothetical protein
VLLEKSEPGLALLELVRRRRLEPVLSDEGEARVAIVLHPLRPGAAGEYAETLAAKELVLLDAVVLVPDPDRVAVSDPIADDFLERDLRDDAVAGKGVPSLEASIANATWGEDDVVALVAKAHGETETGEVRRGDDEPHSTP